MALDTAKATVTLRTLTHKFDEAAKAAKPFYGKLCTTIQSDGADEAYGMLGSMPGVREWLGDRQFKQLRAATFTLKNRLWENSVPIDKDDIADDRMGMYGPALEDLGAEAMYHPDELFFETMAAGQTAACWDGQPFYDTDHSWGDSGIQSNDLTKAAATGTVPTVDEFREAYHAARRALLGFRNDNGKLLNRPVVTGRTNLCILVNPDLELTAKKALLVPIDANGATNLVLDAPEIVATDLITDPTKMYLNDTSGSLKPFVYQAREPLSRKMKGDDDMEFKDVKFMTRSRYNVGYLAWWKSVLTTFT